MGRVIWTLLFLVVCTVTPSAQTRVDGDWQVTINTPQGSNAVLVSLRQFGENISGVLRSPQGDLPLQGGTITGNDVKVTFAVETAGQQVAITLIGTVDGGKMSGKADFGGFGEGEWTAVRVGVEPPPPPPPPPPPQPPPYFAPRVPTWNGWVERGSDETVRWAPVDRLETSTNYSFVLSLALTQYITSTGTTVTAGLGSALKRLIDQFPPNQGPLDLEVLLLAESQFITLDPSFRTFSVNIARLRESLSKDVAGPPVLSFDELRTNPHLDLNFGLSKITFHTTGREGTTSLAISIWHKGVPVEELTMGPLCVTRTAQAPCAIKAAPTVTFAGLDSGLSPATNRQRIGKPLGALHLIHVNDRSAFGVLSRSDGSAYTTWQLDNSIDEIARQLKSSVNASIITAAINQDPVWLEEAGRAIANLLLLGTPLSQGPSPSSVLVDMMKTAASQSGAPPALFVRAIAKGRSPLFGIPLGLANLPLGPPPANREFVGFRLRIEMPLEDVQYDRSPACITKWVVLVPPENDAYLENALKEARSELEPWIRRLRQPSPVVTLYESIPDFAKWVARQAQGDLDSTAIVIVSHHDGGRLYMSPQSALPAANIQRQLRRPGAVILSACGTAEPGNTDIMRNFVQAGANAIVGTGTEVEGRMAGKFVSLFLDELQAHSKEPNASLGQSTFATIQKLRRAKFTNGKEYGAFALLFGLAGDAGLQLCLP